MNLMHFTFSILEINHQWSVLYLFGCYNIFQVLFRRKSYLNEFGEAAKKKDCGWHLLLFN